MTQRCCTRQSGTWAAWLPGAAAGAVLCLLTVPAGADPAAVMLGAADESPFTVSTTGPADRVALSPLSPDLVRPGVEALWRPADDFALAARFRRGQQPAFSPLNPVPCTGGMLDTRCRAAWSAGSESSIGTVWQPFSGFTVGMDYYRNDATVSGANLLPRVLDFIAPGWEDSLSQRHQGGDGVDLNLAYGFDAGVIGELELQVQFSQVLNQDLDVFDDNRFNPATPSLVGDPNTQASLGFNWSRGNFSGSVSSHYTDGVMLDGQVHPAAWTTLDINFAWRTPWNASLSVGARNLLGDGPAGSNLGSESVSTPELDSAFSRIPYVRYEQDL